MNVRTARFGAVLTKLACLMDVETAVSMLTVGEVFTLTKLNRKILIHTREQFIYLLFSPFKEPLCLVIIFFFLNFFSLFFHKGTGVNFIYSLVWYIIVAYFLCWMEILASLFVLTKREKSTFLFPLSL